ncbi:MAG TPA: hypothetical protein VH370_05615 [Humisphaera sp.]|jgi:hypothetical protein|nr:hypothetical protein [Humisphaera sp.]
MNRNALAAVLLHLAAIGAVSQTARAGDYKLDLAVSDGTHKQAVAGPTTMPATQPILPQRPSLTVSLDSKLTAKWKVIYTAKPATKDALVHFFVVRTERTNQAPPALAPAAVLLESAQTLDFESNGTTSAEMGFSPLGPGVYLVRLEAHGESDESFVEIDLIVK